jgi:hypothetical protein
VGHCTLIRTGRNGQRQFRLGGPARPADSAVKISLSQCSARCVVFRPTDWQSSFGRRPLIRIHVSSSAEEEIVAVSLLRKEEQKKKRQTRSFWVHNVRKTRMVRGEFHSVSGLARR